MAHRKEVFQSKVLQKLYPAVPKLEKDLSPPLIVDVLAKKKYVKRKPCEEHTRGGDAGRTHGAANTGRRMYTVLPPPADYVTHSEESFALPHLENTNSAKDPSEGSVDESNDELNHDKEDEVQKRKKRRRKRKSTHFQDSVQDGAVPMTESSTGQSHTAVNEGGEHISRNKKRKLKKKRHKEKLLSMGLMPRASALEFTYKKDGEVEEGEEDNEKRAAEVSDFLRTTLEIYMSDSSVQVDKRPLISETVDSLLSSISSGCKPTSVVQQLCSLKVFVQHKETDQLEKALKELCDNSFMSADETTAVDSLFQYWITDILPMQKDKTETRPQDFL
ncbi:glutamate-rich protein 1 [Anabas testudineus]|uniref:Glutamate rich 1 n=1 Tax=Anabas testudineus TaxID=64144 RepID=A0A3Q1HK78_ANATE|nr:glutamate-rich protein 1 [Anabas testudineus]